MEWRSELNGHYLVHLRCFTRFHSVLPEYLLFLWNDDQSQSYRNRFSFFMEWQWELNSCSSPMFIRFCLFVCFFRRRWTRPIGRWSRWRRSRSRWTAPTAACSPASTPTTWRAGRPSPSRKRTCPTSAGAWSTRSSRSSCSSRDDRLGSAAPPRATCSFSATTLIFFCFFLFFFAPELNHLLINGHVLFRRAFLPIYAACSPHHHLVNFVKKKPRPIKKQIITEMASYFALRKVD